VKADAQCIKVAKRSLTEATKKVHRALKSNRKEVEEIYINVEGQLYGAGITG